MNRPPYRTALGISTGDIIRSSHHGIGPYVVWNIWGPRQWADNGSCLVIWAGPVISLTLVPVDHTGPVKESDLHYINEIHRDGDGWRAGDREIVVEHATAPAPMQQTLFGASPDRDTGVPYRFQPGVDYTRPDVWRCENGHDFDDTQTVKRDAGGHYNGRVRPSCPVCGGWPRPIICCGPADNSHRKMLTGR